MRTRSIFAMLLAGALAALLVWAFSVWRHSQVPGRALVVKWEGAVIGRNFRDFGASLNACLGQPLVREGQVFRAAMWFSGFSCDSVGAPGTILSLNFDPKDGHEYYCVEENGTPNVGKHFNTRIEMNDLEFAKNWLDPTVRAEVCGFFAEGFAAITRGERLLIHCDAGRDRTGTYAALVQALTAEAAGRFDDALIDAVECDYRKTKSLAPAKLGRMNRFLRDVQAQGGPSRFLETHCALPAKVALDAGRALVAQVPPVL